MGLPAVGQVESGGVLPRDLWSLSERAGQPFDWQPPWYGSKDLTFDHPGGRRCAADTETAMPRLAIVPAVESVGPVQRMCAAVCATGL